MSRKHDAYPTGLELKWEILVYILMDILCVGTGISLVYFLHRFLKLSELLPVKKRHFGLLKLQCILTSINLIVFFPLVNLGWAGFHDDGNNSISYSDRAIILRIAFFFNPLITHSIIFIMVFRFYMMYFDAKYFNYLISLKWKIYIDQQIKDKHNNWFVNNKSTYGDMTWIGKRLFIPLWIISSFPFPIYYVVEEYSGIMVLLEVFSYYIPIIMLLILYCKTPKINETKDDCLFMVAEMKAITIIWSVTVTLFLFSGLLNAISLYITAIWLCLIAVTGIYLPSAYSTFVVRRKILHSPYGKTKHRNVAMVHIAVDEHENSYMTGSKENNMTLESVLCNKDYLDLFANHLIREYSVECIVSYIELLEYKRFIKKIINSRDEYKDSRRKFVENKIKEYEFPLIESDLLPRSNIIYDKGIDSLDDIVTISTICFNLYLKFIKSGQEMEVNISYQLRNHFKTLFGDTHNMENNALNDIESLYHLFDDVIAEMYKLMRYSYGRWKRTAQFEQLIDLL